MYLEIVPLDDIGLIVALFRGDSPAMTITDQNGRLLAEYTYDRRTCEPVVAYDPESVAVWRYSLDDPRTAEIFGVYPPHVRIPAAGTRRKQRPWPWDVRTVWG